MPAGAGKRRARSALRLGPYAVGMAVPSALMFAWLVNSGGFPAWLEISREYLPLYLRMTGNHETIEGFARLLYIVKGFFSFGPQPFWLVAAIVIGFLVTPHLPAESERAHRARLLMGEAIAFAIYPTFAGQFWPYHYVPMIYFVTLLASLGLMPIERPRSPAESVVPKVALALALLSIVSVESAGRLVPRGQVQTVRDGDVDAIAAFLKTNLRAGDTVQPLDWVGGVVHAMLIARARLATRFMYDYHFYHHVSHPFIQTLRRRFITEMEQAAPRFVVEFFGENKPWPAGKDTTRDFPELQRLLSARYRVAVATDHYRIYERRTTPAADVSATRVSAGRP